MKARTMIELGDVVDVLRRYKANSFDGVLCDPPYGLSFMGKKWDYDVPSTELWAEVLRVLKPGAPLIAFFGTRTYHRGVVRIEDAGFEIRDCLAWMYGSGFPKSLDVSKAIDKRRDDKEEVRHVCRFLRAAMDARGVKSADIGRAFEMHSRMVDHWAARDTDSQPNLPTWEQWLRLKEMLEFGDAMDAEVWRLNGRKGEPGEAWKGAEIVGRKTGIDPKASRLGFAGETFGGSSAHHDYDLKAPATELARQWAGYGTALKPAFEPAVLARKQLEGTVAENVAKWGVGGLAIDACRVEAPGGRRLIIPGHVSGFGDVGVSAGSKAGGETDLGRWPANVILDEEAGAALDAQTGESPSRFFYCAKASKKDRGAGNNHPTVKPTALTEYLARLILPVKEDSVLLVPFAGSGSEMIGAVRAGWSAVLGVERESEYVQIAQRRLAEVA